MQNRRNSSVLAMELRLSCISLSNWCCLLYLLWNSGKCIWQRVEPEVFLLHMNTRSASCFWFAQSYRYFNRVSVYPKQSWKKIDGDWGSSLTTQDALPNIDTCHWCPFSCPLYYLFYRPGHFSLFSGCLWWCLNYEDNTDTMVMIIVLFRNLTQPT